MTPIQRGRGGWVISGARASRMGAAVLLCAALALAAGCSSKSKPLPGEGAGGANRLGEKGVGGAGSSLSQFQKGTLGQGGPAPLTDIHFAFNDYTVQPQDGSILRENAQWLEKHPNSRVQVEGHCDERGSEEYNIALGAKRAQAAKEYLETLGVSATRISTISYGKELPLCTEHNETCWAENRRDHFVVSE
jgi:peptidoglycan-associated lipoprotein